MKKKSSIIIIVVGVAIVATIFLFSILSDDNSQQKSEQTSDTIQTSNLNNQDKPTDTKRLIFIHHSTGENWLSDYDGQLAMALKDSNYFVSDTNYGWGPDSIGDQTDIGNWWSWFRGSESNNYLSTLYQEDSQNSEYTRLVDNPGGENEIIMFKSCFPNSALKGDANNSIPSISDNSLKGEYSDSDAHTVANAKGIYIDILKYFASKPDKLFIVITAPPLGANNTTNTEADNARAFNNWLVNDWLDSYDGSNVAVFDFYNVLTDDGASNYSQFSTDDEDDHPNTDGNLRATSKFIPFLNNAYQEWQNDL